MKHYKILALAPAILLAACGGKEQAMQGDLPTGSVVYSYPTDGQTGVSPKSDIVIRFSNPVTDAEADLQSEILVNDGTTNIGFTVTKVDGGRSLKLSPDSPLALGTEYSVSFANALKANGATSINTPNATGPEGIQFQTRGGYTGIQSLDDTAADFSVATMVPSPNGLLEAVDFSTFRLLLTQPVDPRWKDMGGKIVLEDDQGNPVPATVLVDERRITVDPCLTDDPSLCGTKDDQLKAGATYTLKIQDLPSQTSPGTTLNFSQAFKIREAGPTVVVYQEAVDSGLGSGASEEQATKSILNGQPINGVTLNSVLQGTAGPSQQTGGLYAELAYAPSFGADEALPLRVPKNSVLNSTSLDVRINGTVPVINPETNQIQQTGNIKVTMLSDASGYLLPNAYTDDLNAPRHVRLFMDVAMNTAEAQPNASLSQNLLGVELDGIAMVKDGVLNIDAIGVVEPSLLGQEYTDSTIAFHLEAKTDANSVLDAADLWQPDTTSPTLVSWMPGPDTAIPGDRDQMQRPGDPIILNFDEPIDSESLSDGIQLYQGNKLLTIGDGNLKAYVDGTAVVVNPVGGLKHGVNYKVEITNQLTDPAGNPVMSQELPFGLPAVDDGSVTFNSPLALTTYPGYPCVTTGVDLDAGTHGQCIDAAPNGPKGQVLPITTLPSNRPIVVVFSQSMDLSTIRPSQTFTVEKRNSDGSYSPVKGRLEKNNQRIRFYPDTPWSTDSYYRYTMSSSNFATIGDVDCANIICSSRGYPLQTDLLVDPEDIGGPDMTIYFRGAPETNSVFTPLRNLPIRDVNANFVVDCDDPDNQNCLEPFQHEGNDTDGYLPSANSAKLGVNGSATALGVPVGAQVGCSTSESCPKKKFIYQTYALNTEVIGPAVDDDTGKTGVRVLLYPTMLATTSASVFLDGFGEQATGPQILRMTYGTPSEDNPLGLVEGIIIEGDDGKPIFKTVADLTLDAPNLSLPLASALSHDLYSKPFSLNLQGPIVFFDDGRMQIEQRNDNAPPIDVKVNVTIPIVGGFLSYAACVDARGASGILSCLTDSTSGVDRGDIQIPLQIPAQGVYLNFISNPIKELPTQP
ncbi:hypothetical protein MSNKSG1_17436 [Marinobacter santoriniensis NKSG1]|uniref:SbsA Ig-like domain-containing protein n=2 Tax=Marinobacter santoriniensis TaxID=523742 RepID=M7CKK9_9GAMM|nr:hypothetical protein MSNKSG1_17436 [Marinobacter santoriniensis NKSG1]